MRDNHVSELKKSKRLQLIHGAMQDGEWWSVRDLIFKTGHTSCGTGLSELQHEKNGIRMETRWRKNHKEYRLIQREAA